MSLVNFQAPAPCKCRVVVDVEGPCVSVDSIEYCKLHAAAPTLLAAAKAVCWFDWSSNDQDAVEAIQKLREAVKAAKGLK